MTPMNNTINEYLRNATWEVKENSNTSFSWAGLQGHIAGTGIKNWAFDELYAGEIAQAHKDALIHIHDLSHAIVGYCCGYGMESIVREGFNCGANGVYSKPAKHLRVLFGQINNFIFTMSGEWAGAQALNSVDTYSSAFIKKDKLSYDQVYHEIKSLIFNLNVKTRISMQSPFTNFSVDITVPDDLADRHAIVGGKEVDFTYGDCVEEMKMFNKALCQVLLEGDGMHGIFGFPIVTFGITPDFPWDSDIAESIFTLAGETGSPYFNNFVSSGLDPSAVRSMCCRLSIDTRELVKSTGGLFGSGDSTGSIGVVTLNASKIGYITRLLSDDDLPNEWDRSDLLYYDKLELVADTNKDKNKAFEIINHYPELSSMIDTELRHKDPNTTKLRIYTIMIKYFCDIAKKSLLIKRKVVQQYMDAGLVPYTKRYLGSYDHHFNTIGINAGHEMCLNMLDKGIDSKEGKELAEYTSDIILKKLSDYQEESNGRLLFNYEATPAEGTSTRFAKADKKDFTGIITGAGTQMDFYTNSTQLPEMYTENIFEVCDHQESLQNKYTSGTVQHIYLSEPVHNWKVVQSLVKKVFTKYKMPYISIAPDVAICPVCGRLHKTTEWCKNDHDPKVVQDLLDKGVLKEDEVR